MTGAMIANRISHTARFRYDSRIVQKFPAATGGPGRAQATLSGYSQRSAITHPAQPGLWALHT